MADKKNSEAPAPEQTVDELLENMKGKYESVLVTGFNSDGHLFMASSVTNIPFMHWTLNKSIFELGLFEKNAQEAKEQANAENEKAPASDVDTEASDS
mgnify:FL=1